MTEIVPEPAGETWQTDLFDIPEYLDAVGIVPGTPNRDLLTRLHDAHVRTFLFANVDVLLDQAPDIDPATVQEQLVRRRRGGYLFEHT